MNMVETAEVRQWRSWNATTREHRAACARADAVAQERWAMQRLERDALAVLAHRDDELGLPTAVQQRLRTWRQATDALTAVTLRQRWSHRLARAALVRSGRI